MAASEQIQGSPIFKNSFKAVYKFRSLYSVYTQKKMQGQI